MKISKKPKKYLLLQAVLFMLAFILISCSEEVPEKEEEEEEEETSLEAFDFNFCLKEETVVFTLPTKISQNENYLQNEYTTELYTAVLAANVFLELPGFFTFPEKGKPVQPVLSNDEELTAYEWGIEAGKFTYQYKTVTDEFNSVLYYELYFQNKQDAFPVIFFEGNQQVSCEFGQMNMFEFTGKDVGDKAYNLQWRTLNTTGLEVDYEVRQQDPNSRRYVIYQDGPGLQGTLTVYIDGKLDKKINWQNDGSGNWEEYENSSVVDSGTWTF